MPHFTDHGGAWVELYPSRRSDRTPFGATCDGDDTVNHAQGAPERLVFAAAADDGDTVAVVDALLYRGVDVTHLTDVGDPANVSTASRPATFRRIQYCAKGASPS